MGRCRCIFDRAPPNVARTIRVEADLEDSAVKSLRPTHKQPYPRVRRAMDVMSPAGESDLFSSWGKLDQFCTFFFKESAEAKTSKMGARDSLDDGEGGRGGG